MKSNFIAAALLAVCAVSCNIGGGSRISMRIEGLGKGDRVSLEKLNVNVCEQVDSITLDSRGSFSRKVDVTAGCPEFYYVTRDGARLASLLVDSRENIIVEADTLGHWTVSGSEGSEKLRQVEEEFSAFLTGLQAASTKEEYAQMYLSYYRSRVKYVIQNSGSLTVVPVLFQQITPYAPVFAQSTDALLFRGACDSLKAVYPDSRYVRALDREASRREKALSMQTMLQKAKEVGFPDLSLPGTDGEKVSLSAVKAKAILVHFWTAQDANQTLLAEDVLKPVYRDYHRRGLEIYSVCIDIDKARWATIVRNQNLPWINVCDGLGAASPSLSTYAVSSLPTTILIADGQVSRAVINGEQSLRKELNKIL